MSTSPCLDDANPLAVAKPSGTRGLVEAVVKRIAFDICAGSVKPGTKLPTEFEIMSRFRVSRTVVREAISQLQARRLVETKHGVGTFALAPQEKSYFEIAEVDFTSLNEVIELLEMRISLEIEASGLAAQRRTQHNLDALQRMLNEFAEVIRQSADSVGSDFEFHMEIARASGNKHMMDLMHCLGPAAIPRSRVDSARIAGEGRMLYLQRIHNEHEDIFNSIRNQDVEAARAAMRTHLAVSMDRLKRSLR